MRHAQEIDEEYGKYRKAYGLTREEYDTIQGARQAGDNYTADRFFEVARKRHEAKANTPGNGNGTFTPSGSSTNSNIPMETNPEDALKAELDKIKALPDEQKGAYIVENWHNYDLETQRQISRIK